MTDARPLTGAEGNALSGIASPRRFSRCYGQGCQKFYESLRPFVQTHPNTINTSFVERHNGTDRNQNARKARNPLSFSKDWEMHNAVTYFVGYSYNFC